MANLRYNIIQPRFFSSGHIIILKNSQVQITFPTKTGVRTHLRDLR